MENKCVCHDICSAYNQLVSGLANVYLYYIYNSLE